MLKAMTARATTSTHLRPTFHSSGGISTSDVESDSLPHCLSKWCHENHGKERKHYPHHKEWKEQHGEKYFDVIHFPSSLLFVVWVVAVYLWGSFALLLEHFLTSCFVEKTHKTFTFVMLPVLEAHLAKSIAIWPHCNLR